MRARIFLSYDVPADRLADLAEWTERLGLSIAGRYVPIGGAMELIPDLRQQLQASEAVVVAFGRTQGSHDVEREIEWSYEDAKGIVGVRFEQDAPVPAALYDAGAEILDWSDGDDRDRLGGAIRAATQGAELMERARKAGTGSGARCARPIERRRL